MTGSAALRALTPKSASARGLTVRPRITERPAGIVHLGLSNFHRGHQALYTAKALDVQEGPWGITGVARQTRDVIDALNAQGLAYSILTLDGEQAHADIVRVHQDLVVGADDPGRVVSAIAAPATRIVTITVTEAGYTYDPLTGTLDRNRSALAGDLTGRAPQTTIGQLAAGIRQRHAAGGLPLTVMSCDNLVENGALTSRLVREFLQLTVPVPELAELDAWMLHNMTFPSSMVDRIVPRTTQGHRDLSRKLTGLDDSCPVPAEAFSMWVIEDKFATERPLWNEVGAVISDDVHSYELLKIRLLNGTHSLIAYLGMLFDAETIDASIGDMDVHAVADAFMDEMCTTLQVPEGLDLDDYRRSLFRRFANTATGHRTSQVGSDGSLKVPTRISDPVIQRSAEGLRSPMSALLAAVFILVTTQPAATSPSVREGLRDPSLDLLQRLGGEHPSAPNLVRAVIVESGIFPAGLAHETGFLADCVEFYEMCSAGGTRAAIQSATLKSPTELKARP